MTHGNFNCKINCLNDGLVVLGLATSHHENKTDAGTPDWPSLVSPSMVSVFVGRRLTMTLLPPANKSTFNKKFYICSDATHTHTSHIARFDFGRSSRTESAKHQSK